MILWKLAIAVKLFWIGNSIVKSNLTTNHWKYNGLRIEYLPVRQPGNSKKNKYWTEVRRQKPEEKHLITLFELLTPVKKKKFIETKVSVINLTAVRQVYRDLTNNLKIKITSTKFKQLRFDACFWPF